MALMNGSDIVDPQATTIGKQSKIIVHRFTPLEFSETSALDSTSRPLAKGSLIVDFSRRDEARSQLSTRRPDS